MIDRLYCCMNSGREPLSLRDLSACKFLILLRGDSEERRPRWPVRDGQRSRFVLWSWQFFLPCLQTYLVMPVGVTRPPPHTPGKTKQARCVCLCVCLRPLETLWAEGDWIYAVRSIRSTRQVKLRRCFQEFYNFCIRPSMSSERIKSVRGQRDCVCLHEFTVLRSIALCRVREDVGGVV